MTTEQACMVNHHSPAGIARCERTATFAAIRADNAVALLCDTCMRVVADAGGLHLLLKDSATGIVKPQLVKIDSIRKAGE